MVLLKKLKKARKECRQNGGPVLLTLSAYLDHVINYLKRGPDGQLDAHVSEYGNALAQVDLSAVVKAHQALVAAEPMGEQPAVESATPAEAADGKEKEAKRGKKKDKKKAEEPSEALQSAEA